MQALQFKVWRVTRHIATATRILFCIINVC